MSGLKIRKDYASAVIVTTLGAAVMGLGLTYQMGSLRQMEAGFMAVVFGLLMILVGVALGLAGLSSKAPETEQTHLDLSVGLQWRGWLCIVGGVIANCSKRRATQLACDLDAIPRTCVGSSLPSSRTPRGLGCLAATPARSACWPRGRSGDAAFLDDLAQPRVHVLDGVGRVDHPAHRR